MSPPLFQILHEAKVVRLQRQVEAGGRKRNNRTDPLDQTTELSQRPNI